MATEVLNEKLPTFAEGMLAASKSEDPEQYLKDLIKKDNRWVNILGYAINPHPNYKMDLPEGTPPYKPSDAPMALAEIEILHLATKIYVLYNKESKRIRKEEIFMGWLEKLNPTEAEMLIAIKDKKLHKIYKRVSEYKIVNALGWNVDDYKAMKAKYADPK